MSAKKITNLLHEALRWNDYNPGESDYTPSSLLKPAQQTYLACHHEPQDQHIYQGFMAFMGTMCHSILERLAEEIEGCIAEVRYYHTFKGVGRGEKKDIVVGGQIDFCLPPYLVDYKVTTTSNFFIADNKEVKAPHYDQAQINGYLLRKNGVDVEVGVIAYLFRDWSFGRSKKDSSYPQTPDQSFSFDIKPMEEVEPWLLSLVDKHERAKIGDYAPCTPEEMWARPDTYAVKKPQNKRARRVFETEKEAVAECGKGEIVERRHGERVRCESWCPFSHVCPQYAEYKKQK